MDSSHLTFLVIGALIFAVGGGGALWLRKRRFDRTNAAGVQEYNSFTGMIFSNSLGCIIGLFAFAFMFVGIAFILEAFGVIPVNLPKH